MAYLLFSSLKINSTSHLALYKEATQIKYHIAIKSNETWFNTETTVINLRIDENHNVPQNTSGNNETPGFELVFVLCAIAVAIFLWRKKRSV